MTEEARQQALRHYSHSKVRDRYDADLMMAGFVDGAEWQAGRKASTERTPEDVRKLIEELRDLAEAWDAPRTPPIVTTLRAAADELEASDDLARRLLAENYALGAAVSSPPTITDDSEETVFVCGNCNAGIPDDHIGPKVRVTDDMVERAAHKMFEPDGPGGDYTWAEMVREDPSRADIWRADARAVLVAALGGEEKEQ